MVGTRVTSEDEDRAEVEVLQARLERTRQLTKKVKTSQARLDASGSSVKEAIGPIYGNTQRLQVLGTNIDNVNNAIAKLRQPSDVWAEEERIIREGPQASDLSLYIQSMVKLTQTMLGYKTANLRVNHTTISGLKSLLSYGREQLADLFREILLECSRKVEPLHYLTKDVPFPTISAGNITRLRQISSFMNSFAAPEEGQGEPFSCNDAYIKVRSFYLGSSLQTLGAGTMSSARRRGAGEVYRRGGSGLEVYGKGLEGIMTAEHANVYAIFPASEWSAVFIETCRGPLNDLTKTLRDLNSQIRTNITTDCFLAYEIIDVVSKLSYELDKKTGELKSIFAEALKPIRDTAKLSLSELLEDLRRRLFHLQSLPMDGGAVSITAETMSRLQNMAEFSEPLAAILISLGDGNWISNASSKSAAPSGSSASTFDVGADGQKLLGHYCLDTVETLLQNLDSKARNLIKSKAALGVFLANNVAVVERMIRTSNLAPLLSGSLARIEAWRKKGVSLYLDSWKEPSSYLLDVQYTNRAGQRPPSGTSSSINSAEIVKSLSSKDKDSIKEKFRAFNTSFEDMMSRHKSFSMEREVRSTLGKEVQALIEPLYGRFWDRYHEVDKGKGKYVKYDRGQLTAVLASLG